MAQKELQIGHKLINTTMECTHIYYINAGMKFACTYMYSFMHYNMRINTVYIDRHVYIHRQSTNMQRSPQTKQYTYTDKYVNEVNAQYPWSQWNMTRQFCGRWCCYGGLLQVASKGQETWKGKGYLGPSSWIPLEATGEQTWSVTIYKLYGWCCTLRNLSPCYVTYIDHPTLLNVS